MRLKACAILLMFSALFVGTTTLSFGQAPKNLQGTGYTVGSTAYDFIAPDQFGDDVSLYQFYGQYILLDYVATWCVPCNYDVKITKQATEDLTADGYPTMWVQQLIQDIGFVPSTQFTALRWANRWGLTSPVLHVAGGISPWWEMFQQYGNVAGYPGGVFPTYVIISPRMKILTVAPGSESEDVGLWIKSVIEADLAADPTSRALEVAALVNSYGLPYGTANSLTSKMKNLVKAVDEANASAACGMANAFNNELAAQLDNKLTQAQAAQLSGKMTLLKAQLGCQ